MEVQEQQVNLTDFLRLGKDTLFYGGINVATKAVSLALIPIYTRFFVPSEYGIIELLMTASALLSRVFSVGVDSALLRFYHDCSAQDRRNLASTILTYLAIVGIPVAIVLSFFSNRLSRLLFNSDVHSSLVTLMLVAIPFIMIGWIPQDLTRLKFEKLKYNFLIVGGNVFYAVAALILIVVLHKGLWGVMFSHFLRAILFVLFGIVLIRQDFSLRIDLSKLKRVLTFGAPLLPATIALWVSNSSDRFFLAKLASLHSVGVYSVANRLAWVQWFIFSSFQLAFTPIAYSIYKRPDAAVIFRKVFVYYIVLSSILGLTISVFGLDLLRILTPPPYHPAHMVLGLLNLSIILHGVFYIFGIGISIAKKTKYFAYSYVLGAIANISLNLLLIPTYGVMGAASATLISFGITAILGAYWSKRSYPLRFPMNRLVIICSLFLSFCLLGIWLNSSLGEYILPKLLTVFVFAGLMFLLLDREDRILLIGLSKRFLKSRKRGL